VRLERLGLSEKSNDLDSDDDVLVLIYAHRSEILGTSLSLSHFSVSCGSSSVMGICGLMVRVKRAQLCVTFNFSALASGTSLCGMGRLADRHRQIPSVLEEGAVNVTKVLLGQMLSILATVGE
jgi:hypothetical protein